MGTVGEGEQFQNVERSELSGSQPPDGG